MLRVLHLTGRRSGVEERFDHAPIRIGTAPGSDVLCVAGVDGDVAPFHAELRFEEGRWWLVDLGGAAGTWVRGVRVRRVHLGAGDEVALGAGGVRLRVEPVGSPQNLRPPAQARADGRVGLKTAQMLVQAAVLRAAGGGRAEAILAQRIESGRRRLARKIVLLGAGLVVLAAAAVVAALYLVESRREAAELRVEVGLAAGGGASLGSDPNPSAVLTGRQIHEANRLAVYVLTYERGGRVGGCCSAFAIERDLLATNAHCVRACREKGGENFAVQNESKGRVRLRVTAMNEHPRYRGRGRRIDSPDVALVRVSGRLPQHVALASAAELRSIGPGDDAVVIGFPGRVMDPLSPSATFLSGRVGRVLGFDDRPAVPSLAQVIQHDAPTRGGSSGSPIFNQHGRVIAMHTAHLDEESEATIDGKKTTIVESSPFRVGLRIDLLGEVPRP